MPIVQTVSCDPAPSNVGNLGGAGDVSGGHLCVSSILGFTAGNYLLGIGATANFAGTTAVKITDPVNGDWNTIEHLNCRSAPGGVTDGLDVILAYIPTAAISPGFVGKISASSAGQATVTKFDGTSPGWTTNQWSSASATCQEYSTGVGGTVTSNTSNVLNFSGGGTPPVGNPIVVGGFVKFVNTSSGEDFTIATIVEISGVGSLIGHSSNQNTFTSGVNLPTGNIAPWTGTGISVAFAFDDEDNTAGPYSPTSATGTDDGALWLWSLSSPICRMQHQIVTSPGSNYGMNFTTRNAEHHQAFLAAFMNSSQQPLQSQIIF